MDMLEKYSLRFLLYSGIPKFYRKRTKYEHASLSISARCRR